MAFPIFLPFDLLIKIFVECIRKVWYSVIRKRKHPLQKWMPHRVLLSALMGTAPLLADRGAYFLCFFFLFERKASNATIKLPKAHNKVNMPMKIEMISKAVI